MQLEYPLLKNILESMKKYRKITKCSFSAVVNSEEQ